jgi:hypothetical protein
MYIRGNRKRRLKEGWREKEGDYIYAALVETHRINGKPRQKVIKYLGGIGEDALLHVYLRKCFWDTVEKNLSALELTTEKKNKIVASLEKTVPKPTDADISADFAEYARTLQEFLNKR